MQIIAFTKQEIPFLESFGFNLDEHNFIASKGPVKFYKYMTPRGHEMFTITFNGEPMTHYCRTFPKALFEAVYQEVNRKAPRDPWTRKLKKP